MNLQETLERVLSEAKEKEARRLRVWNSLPCQGKTMQVKACLPHHEAQCEYRTWRECPKQVLREQTYARQERRRQALERGIPERILHSVYDRPPRQTLALQTVRTFMNARDKSILVLSGPNACGKTSAAAWACLPPLEADWPDPLPGLFVRLVDLEAAGRFSELLLKVRKSPLVVLDDLGAAHFGVSGFTSSLVDDVVDAIYQACHKLILTTDLAIAPDPSDPSKSCLAHVVSKRVMSRIKDAGVIETRLGGRYSNDGNV